MAPPAEEPSAAKTLPVSRSGISAAAVFGAKRARNSSAITKPNFQMRMCVTPTYGPPLINVAARICCWQWLDHGPRGRIGLGALRIQSRVTPFVRERMKGSFYWSASGLHGNREEGKRGRVQGRGLGA